MKKIIKNHTIIMCILFGIILGFIIGRDISKDFLELYLGKLAQIPTRYIIIIVVLFVDYHIFNNINYTSVIFRHKSLLNFFWKCLIRGIKYISLFFISLNFPIFILNMKDYIANINVVGVCAINGITINVLFISIVRLIDVFLKHRTLSSCLFIVIFTLLDFILAHYNFFAFANVYFDFSYLFVLPSIYNYYHIIFFILILLIIIIICISASLSIKKDYVLNDKIIEKN